jgi:hypothetical protein
VIPRPDQALLDLAGRIGTRIAPALTDPYAAADAGMISMLLIALAKEMGSGVAQRMADGAELSALFADAAHAPGAAARADFAGSEPESLTLEDVNAWLDNGLRLLVELHAWAETHEPALDRAIWDWLYQHTERHKFPL